MKILLVVDMQKDFVDGALGTPEAQAIVPKVKAKVDEYTHMYDGVIVYTRDTHYADYMDTNEGKHLPVPHCIIDTEGWELVPEIINEESAIAIFNKETFGKYNIADDLLQVARDAWETTEIDSIEIVGLCTDICVVSNALILKANFPEVPIFVDSACCAGVTPAKHEAALEVMRSCQIEVI